MPATKRYFLRKILLITAVLTGPVLGAVTELPEPFRVIPQPQKVELLGGAGLGFGQLEGVRLVGDFDRPIMGEFLDCLGQSDGEGQGVLTLRLSREENIPESKEGYVLVVSGQKAEISSQGEAGLFYGCQTLTQLLEDARDTATEVPACRITDYPALSYRAVHFDTKHHLDNMKYYYDSIERLARCKINAIIFEFEDKLRYQRQPVVGAPQAISLDEMAALTNYARQRHIEISPLVQGLGHATFILKHQQYVHLREDPEDSWVFCPLHEGTYQVLFDLYRDAIEATPSARYLHVGGDEIGAIGRCPRCKPMAQKEGILGLNLYWLNRVCEFARQQGRTAIFWDDMPLQHAGVYQTTHRDNLSEADVTQVWEKGLPVLNEMIDRFPKNCVYMRWNYSLARQAGNIRALDWYRDSGLEVMIATAAQNVSALLPTEDRVKVIQSFIQLAAERNIGGMLCTAWDDASPHMETYWRGLIASGEYSWSPRGRSREEYEVAYLQRMFGPECLGATNLYAELYAAADFWWRALLEDGNRNAASLKIIEVPDRAAPGRWSRTHKDRLAQAEKEQQRHEKISAQLADLTKKARRNHYHLALLTAINDFQITAADLLLALRACDVADKEEQEAGRSKVRQSLSKFERQWNKLMEVYGKTRFLAYPDNYVKDRYFHFASKREDQTWLILAEEQYHQRVREWLKAGGE